MPADALALPMMRKPPRWCSARLAVFSGEIANGTVQIQAALV
jgi:hypothetical protein